MPNVTRTECSNGTPLFTTALYGPDLAHIRDTAVELGATPDCIYLLKSASTKDDIGFRTIWQPGEPTYAVDEFTTAADAIMLTKSGQTVVHFTADCPVVVLYDAVAHRLIAAHAGRPAMSPDEPYAGIVTNIITDCWEALNAHDPTQVLVKITGAIGAEDFAHPDETGQALIKNFDWFGQHAFHNRSLGTIDLPRIICAQLIERGVHLGHMEFLGPSTFKTPWLASYRRDKATGRNRIIVVLH